MSSPARQISNADFYDGAWEKGPWRRRLLVLFWAVVATLGAAGIVAWRSLDSLISMPLL